MLVCNVRSLLPGRINFCRQGGARVGLCWGKKLIILRRPSLPPSRPHFLFVAKVGETIICLRIVYWRKAILRWAFLSVSIFVFLNCETLTSNHALQFNLESVWTERQISSLPLFPWTDCLVKIFPCSRHLPDNYMMWCDICNYYWSAMIIFAAKIQGHVCYRWAFSSVSDASHIDNEWVLCSLYWLTTG